MTLNPITLVIGSFMLLAVEGSLRGAYAQDPFERTYGGLADDIGLSVLQMQDGGFVVAGLTYSYGSGSSDVYLMRTDSTGDTIWTRTYGSPVYEIAHSVCQASEGGFILAGERFFSFYILKVDSVGDTLWTRVFGPNNKDTAYEIRQTLDGNYIVCGTTGSIDGYLLKLNESGEHIWEKRYEFVTSLRSVYPTDDGGYILTGYGHPSRGLYLIKTDALGDTVWTRWYGPGTQGYSVQQTRDGGYVVAGYGFFVLKTDSFGNEVWSNLYGGAIFSGTATSIDQTHDGEYVVVGIVYPTDKTPSDALLVKIDYEGELVWSRTFGEYSYGENGIEVRQLLDGGFAVVGSSGSTDTGALDVYLIKTLADGTVDVGDETNTTPLHFSLLQNYPNPFNGNSNFEFRISNLTDVTLKVYNLLGREVATIVNERLAPGVYTRQWDAAGMASGVYVYRLITGDFVQTRKLTLVR